jgi:hypothetical protein
MNIYAHQRPLGPIADDEALRQQFIAVYDVKTHQQVVHFCRAYGHRLHELTSHTFPYSSDIADAYAGMEQWLAGEANYHAARNASFRIGRQARYTTDRTVERFLRTMAQLMASPHVKYHGLWASDFAITLINTMYPNDEAAVRNERIAQIQLLKSIN